MVLSEDFKEMQRELLGTEQAELLFCALDGGQVPTSVRVNPYKGTKVDGEPVAWCAQGYYLDTRPVFATDPLWHSGGYYVQEASSMMVGWALEQIGVRGARVLDLCAAPGGKTTHLASIVGRQGVVVANEVMRPRAMILAQNVQRWGSGNVAVTNCDPQRLGTLSGMFDVVVVDAPCSGEGMFRKDLAARQEWSVANVALCQARSRRIVSHIWDALKMEGVMIYSTCTFNRQEDEDNVAWICDTLGAELIELSDVPPGVVDSGMGLHCYPHLVRGEGFFMAALRKSSPSGGCPSKKRQNVAGLTAAQREQCNRWVREPLEYLVGGQKIYGMSAPLAEMVEQLRSMNLVYSGVLMGEFIRQDLKPSPPLALYYDVNRGMRPVSELTRADIMEYLRCGVLDGQKYEPGLSLVSHQGVAVGWAKRIDNRVNNLYPNNWRLRDF